MFILIISATMDYLYKTYLLASLELLISDDILTRMSIIIKNYKILYDSLDMPIKHFNKKIQNIDYIIFNTVKYSKIHKIINIVSKYDEYIIKEAYKAYYCPSLIGDFKTLLFNYISELNKDLEEIIEINIRAYDIQSECRFIYSMKNKIST